MRATIYQGGKPLTRHHERPRARQHAVLGVVLRNKQAVTVVILGFLAQVYVYERQTKAMGLFKVEPKSGGSCRS
jgi:hypothetical protein